MTSTSPAHVRPRTGKADALVCADNLAQSRGVFNVGRMQGLETAAKLRRSTDPRRRDRRRFAQHAREVLGRTRHQRRRHPPHHRRARGQGEAPTRSRREASRGDRGMTGAAIITESTNPTGESGRSPLRLVPQSWIDRAMQIESAASALVSSVKDAIERAQEGNRRLYAANGRQMIEHVIAVMQAVYLPEEPFGTAAPADVHTVLLRAEVLRWCDHVQRFEYLRHGSEPDASPHILADHARKLATAPHEMAVQPQWQPVDTWDGQPTGPAASVLVCVSDGGAHDPLVGEAWYDPDAYGGTWWWANLDKGDYHASPIVEMQHGDVTHWMPLPAAPEAARKDDRA